MDTATLANLSVAVGLLLAGLAFLLMVVGIVAYVRLRHGRMLWISIAFGLLAGQGAWYAWDAFHHRADASFPSVPVVSLAVVFALYLAVLRR